MGDDDPFRLRYLLVFPEVEALEVELVAVPANANRAPARRNGLRDHHPARRRQQMHRHNRRSD